MFKAELAHSSGPSMHPSSSYGMYMGTCWQYAYLVVAHDTCGLCFHVSLFYETKYVIFSKVLLASRELRIVPQLTSAMVHLLSWILALKPVFRLTVN
jgi:hypothetical protein